MTADGLAVIVGIFALTLTIVAFVLKRPDIGFGASIFWIVVAFAFLQESAATWDVYFGAFWGAIAMGIITPLATFVLRPKAADDELHNALNNDSWEDYGEEMQKHRDNLDKARSPSRRSQQVRRSEEEEKKRISRMFQ